MERGKEQNPYRTNLSKALWEASSGGAREPTKRSTNETQTDWH